MKFNDICYYTLKESYKGKFIAISDIAEQIKILDNEILKITKKPQINIPDLTTKFIKRLIYNFKYDLPASDEVNRNDISTQFTKEDIIEKITQQVAITFEVKNTKAKQAAIALFRLFIKKGILKVVSWAEMKKTKEEENDALTKAIGDPETTEWMSGVSPSLNPNEIETLTGGFSPERSNGDWN